MPEMPHQSKKRRQVTIAVIGVVLLTLLVVAGGSLRSACATCHGTVVSAGSNAAHASTGCYDCHAPRLSDRIAFKAYELVGMYPAAFSSRNGEGPVQETTRDACLACHAGILDETLPGDKGMRIAHLTCATGPTCDTCHATTAHGEAVRWKRQPVMEDCTACHRQQGASTECDVCHVGKLQSERLEVGPWQVTHGPEWRSTHGMGATDSCATCHPNDFCVKCHAVAIPHPVSFGATHGIMALGDRESCETCHRAQAFCDSCHGIEMPHAADYLERHATDAGTKDNQQCMRCHALEDCERCHVRHIHPGGVRNGLTLPVPGGDGS